MSFESELVTLLESITDLTDLVGNRIFQVAAADPSTSKPYLLFEVIATDEPGHLSGSSGLARSMVQFRAVGGTSVDAIAVRDALRAGIHTLRHTTGVIRDVRIESSRNSYFQPESGQPVGIHSQEMDYIIWHTVDNPSPV